jgi:hypothetical protein
MNKTKQINIQQKNPSNDVNIALNLNQTRV